MKCSFVIVTHDRKDALLRTLSILHRNHSLPPGSWDAWVVDNGSTDGTVDAVCQSFSHVNIIARPTNEGVWARSYAFDQAAGEYLILLDDADSYPIEDAAGCLGSIEYLDMNPAVRRAVVGQIVLPDGLLGEACAMPSVMLSGSAVCVRALGLE